MGSTRKKTVSSRKGKTKKENKKKRVTSKARIKSKIKKKDVKNVKSRPIVPKFEVIIFKGFWVVDNVKKNPTGLFVFGDNDQRVGAGGQAIIRYEPNAAGLSTKKFPGFFPEAFYTDKEFEQNKIKIDNNIIKIKERLASENYTALVLPENGLGTGLSKLQLKAPKTLKYINNQIVKLVNNRFINNKGKFKKTYGA